MNIEEDKVDYIRKEYQFVDACYNQLQALENKLKEATEHQRGCLIDYINEPTIIAYRGRFEHACEQRHKLYVECAAMKRHHDEIKSKLKNYIFDLVLEQTK